MMFNDAVEAAFTFTEEESWYGGPGFGESVFVARKVVEQDQGTRFVQVDHTGWDHHSDIYGTLGLNANSTIYAQAAEFDPAFAALVADPGTSGKLSERLIVVCGEFGRTPGALSAEQAGRDHDLQMLYVFAGGGIRGGTVIEQQTTEAVAVVARSRPEPAGLGTATSGRKMPRRRYTPPLALSGRLLEPMIR